MIGAGVSIWSASFPGSSGHSISGSAGTLEPDGDNWSLTVSSGPHAAGSPYAITDAALSSGRPIRFADMTVTEGPTDTFTRVGSGILYPSGAALTVAISWEEDDVVAPGQVEDEFVSTGSASKVDCLEAISNTNGVCVDVNNIAENPLEVNGRVGAPAVHSALAIDNSANSAYGAKTTAFDGPPASKVGTLSLWSKHDDTMTSFAYLIECAAAGSSATFQFAFANDSRYLLSAWNAAGTLILKADTPWAGTDADVWNHDLISWDLGNGVFQWYHNDAIMSVTPSTLTDDFVGAADAFSIFANINGNGDYLNSMSEAYMENAHYDLSNATNRRLFTDATGKPVTLPNNADTYLRLTKQDGDAPATWFENTADGSATDVPVVGTPVADASSPSD